MPNGKRVLKAKNLEVKYEANLELPGGREGVKRKILCGKSRDIFWNCTMNDHYWSQATRRWCHDIAIYKQNIHVHVYSRRANEFGFLDDVWLYLGQLIMSSDMIITGKCF